MGIADGGRERFPFQVNELSSLEISARKLPDVQVVHSVQDANDDQQQHHWRRHEDSDRSGQRLLAPNFDVSEDLYDNSEIVVPAHPGDGEERTRNSSGAAPVMR
jgi:hypothetical protein